MLKLRNRIFCVLAIMALAPTQGEEHEQLEQLMDSFAEEELNLECFRCDLGFWDACYTTKTNCSHSERCFTGRGKAGDILDIKTLGCVKAEECGVETTVELLPNQTVFVMTKHCCGTPLCNSAPSLPLCALLYVTVAFLTTCDITGAPR